MYTESVMLPLGTVAPDFTLPDTVSGKMVSLSDIVAPKGLVVMFLCNHCPYVLHINAELVRLAHEFHAQGVGFVGISSNDAVAYPEDGPEQMTTHAREVAYFFPYLYDETQEVARTYDAACTPDFYVFDAAKRLYYRGQMDSSRPKRNPVPATGDDLRNALAALLAGQPAPADQRPSGGCNIKWK
jgi:peroxiredoxin